MEAEMIDTEIEMGEVVRVDLEGNEVNGCEKCGEEGYLVVETLEDVFDGRYSIEIWYVCPKCGNFMDRDGVYEI